MKVAHCLLIVDEFRDCRIISTDGARSLAASVDLAEIHRLGVKCEQLVGKQFAHSSEILQSLSSLNGAKHTGNCSKYTSL